MVTNDLFEESPVASSTPMAARIQTRSVVTNTLVASAPVGTPRLDAGNVSHNSDFFPLPQTVLSPVNIDALHFYLSQHPDHSLVSYVVNGFREGFDIGFVGHSSA